MNKLNLASLTHERVSIQVGDLPEGVLVTITGDIDMQDPAKLLDPFFQELHRQAVQKGTKRVDLDVRQLNFLNSSGIRALAKWIMALLPLKVEQRYQIRMLHNKGLAWQAASLPTLTFLVPGAVVLG